MNVGNDLIQRPEGLDVHARIALDLGERGWSLCEDFLPPLLVSQLLSEARELWQGGGFRPAGVGRGQKFEVRPEVRNVSYPSDFLLALLVMAPFLTGFIAHQQWLPYNTMIIIHGFSGALWLLAIPWTRLIHMLWFAFTRAFMGSDSFSPTRSKRRVSRRSCRPRVSSAS